MSISAISSGSSSYQMGASSRMDKMKQNFDDLGTSLKSGNLDDAKKAFAKLQKNAPSGGDGKQPPEMESLQKALDSGDLKGAQEAYSKIEQKMSQGPPAGAPGGAPPSQAAQSDSQSDTQKTGTGKSSSSATSSNKTYDKRDANKDGTVSTLEALTYELKNSNDTSSAVLSDNNQNKSDFKTYA